MVRAGLSPEGVMTNGVLSRVAFLLCIACSMCMTHATAASGAAPESVAFNITTAAVVVQGDIDAIAPALDVLLEGVRIRSLITLSVSTSGAVADNPLIVLVRSYLSQRELPRALESMLLVRLKRTRAAC